MDGVLSKRELRRRVLAARRELSGRARAAAGAAIRDAVLALPEVSSGRTVAVYYAVGSEPDTRPLVAALSERGGTVLLPVFLDGGELDWAPYTGPDSLAPAGHGLVEPTGPRLGVDAVRGVSALVCPALAVDAAGYRLGRGAGCYDRALARAGEGAVSLAVVYDTELVESVPTEEHDRPVRGAVTPGRGVVWLGNR
ncbi:5-formyltetrahydrofolate cyclo-ligase [Thermobifida halotolerans]|uniref:5-formyltetrahydrofolate cyclo-ligase n=1 Tax=Thermobifida halotolerans TaxID=483545 RepID=A0A399G327_9ACTN|nr:5-formyltetrahydrofolate cyclo-ligase [Thermobifida halotolerans]UOE19464.1 5-formyltetrahydrofolate cyclo-ligase [Thermobifida halotolerans]